MIIVVLVGCGMSQNSSKAGITVTDGVGSAAVQEITLSDGTRCAAMVGYQKGSISCNWKGN